MQNARRDQRTEKQAKRARRVPPFNLVALMDIFTILVFFLLVNSSDVQEISTPRSVDLPESIADTNPREAPTVLITADDIRIDGEAVAEVAPLLGDEALIIQSLRDALAPDQPDAGPADRGEITILGDRSIPYRVLKKVMATCADAGFGRISLAVMQKANQGS